MRPLSKKVSGVERSQTLLLFARAKKMRAEGIDVVSLTAGEPDFPTPAAVKEAGIRAIKENFTKYTANQGIPELLRAIAEKFRRDNNLDFDPSQILVSSGAKHALYNALQAICNPGDEVIIPSPYWVSYPEMVKLVGATPVIVRTRASDQFKISPAQLRKAVTRKSKLFIFCSPSNPTGVVYTREEIEGLARVIAQAGLYVISDEIYEKIIYDGMSHFSMGSLPSVRDLVVTVNGVSKAFSMTGWRIGFLGANRDLASAAEKVQGQITSNASSISQRAALAALTSGLDGEVHAMVEEFARRRKFLCGAFDQMNVEYIKPHGAFYIFARVKPILGGKKAQGTIDTTDALSEYLLNSWRVALVPGGGFGAKDWVRISYACSMQDLEKAAERLQKAFAELRGAQ